jgi:hypothetical protein
MEKGVKLLNFGSGSNHLIPRIFPEIPEKKQKKFCVCIPQAGQADWTSNPRERDERDKFGTGSQ